MRSWTWLLFVLVAPAALAQEAAETAPAEPSPPPAADDAAPAESTEGSTPSEAPASADEAPDALGSETAPSAPPETAPAPTTPPPTTAPPPTPVEDDPLYQDEERYQKPGQGGEKAPKKAKKRKEAKKRAERPPEDDVGAFTPSGLNGFVVWPIQLCGGCVTLGVLETLTIPLTAIPVLGWLLRALIIWGVTGTVITTVGDGLGKNRSVIGWPTLAGMCVDTVCGGAAALVTGIVAVALLGSSVAGVVGLIQVADPSMLPEPEVLLTGLGVLLSGVGIVTGGVGATLFGGARCASLNAASATYFLVADDKQDDDFRFPGLFTPDHGQDEKPTKARGKKRRPRPDDEGYDDEGYEDEEVDEEVEVDMRREEVRLLPGELAPPRLAGVRSAPSMAF